MNLPQELVRINQGSPGPPTPETEQTTTKRLALSPVEEQMSREISYLEDNVHTDLSCTQKKYQGEY
jgi:hypothetical protein